MYLPSTLFIFIYTYGIISLETSLQFLMLLYLKASLIIIFVTLQKSEDGFIVAFFSSETELQNT